MASINNYEGTGKPRYNRLLLLFLNTGTYPDLCSGKERDLMLFTNVLIQGKQIPFLNISVISKLGKDIICKKSWSSRGTLRDLAATLYISVLYVLSSASGKRNLV